MMLAPAESDADERTNLLLSEAPRGDAPPSSSTEATCRNARNVLLATTLGRFGSRSWEFASPLLLLEWSPGSLVAPAAFGLAKCSFQVVASPWLGGRADGWDRFLTVVVGAGMQAAGCLVSVGALLLWNSVGSGGGSSDGGNKMGHLLSLALVIVAGVIEALGARLASVAVKKEWVPIVFDESDGDNECERERSDDVDDDNDDHDDDAEACDGRKDILSFLCFNVNLPSINLSFINTTMTNIDLTAAIFGPILAGWILQILGEGVGGGNDGEDGSPAAYSMQRGFVVIALMNVVSFVPEALLLRRVYDACPALRRRRGGDDGSISNETERTRTTPKDGDEDEAASTTTTNPWLIWFHHPSGLPLLTISLASLYLTVLSPAGIVLTAYLVMTGMSPKAVSIFRAAGALSGVAGIGLFAVARNWGEGDCNQFQREDEDAVRTSSARSIERLRRVSLAFLLSEVASVLVAAFAFSRYDSSATNGWEDGSAISWSILLFLVAVYASRAGLYSFDVGALEIQQHIVDERYRNAVGSVEGALCSLVEMGMYILSMTLPDPSQFGILVGLSAAAVSFSGACFAAFMCNYLMHGHHHHVVCEEELHLCHSHSHSHHHTHTFQQKRELQKYNGYHIHLHRHRSFSWSPKIMANSRPCDLY